MRLGLEIAVLLERLYPQNFDASKTVTLLGNDETVQKLRAGASAAEIVSSWQPALARYDQARRRNFLYK